MALDTMRNSFHAFAPDVSKAVITDVSHAARGARKIFISFLRRLHAWWRYQDTVWQLSNLSDHQLDDIGIKRGDIPRVASGSSRRPEDGSHYHHW
jgi:uncharacterized protein YjiS (DUF1127 family)